MSVVVSLAARKETPDPNPRRRRAVEGRRGEIVILPCIRREPLADDSRPPRRVAGAEDAGA